MKKSAQNIVEIGLLITLVIVVSVGVVTMLNNKKLDMTKLAKVQQNQEATNGSSGSSGGTQNKPNSDFWVESAGSLSNIIGKNVSTADFIEKSQDLSLEDIKDTSVNGKTIVDTANELIKTLGLDMAEIERGTVTDDTLRQIAQAGLLAQQKIPQGAANELFNTYKSQLMNLVD